ncbi:MAG: helix-turn-helix domain-containing protein [Bacteroidales bacterium]|nr:helix-turn-helix domain-containing protein [Bacteroidales bacterium]
MENMYVERFIDAQELAELLSIKKECIYQMVYRRTIPFYKIGRCVRFRWSEIENNMKKHDRD